MDCSSQQRQSLKEIEMTAAIAVLIVGAIALALLAIDRYREKHAHR